MLIWYKPKYLQWFGSSIKRRFIFFQWPVGLKPQQTQNKPIFPFFALSTESVIHTELSTLCSCQLCINNLDRNSAIESHTAVQAECLQEALHLPMGQCSSHTELAPVTLYQIVVKSILKLKRCDINNNSKCDATSGILICVVHRTTIFQICFLGFSLPSHL